MDELGNDFITIPDIAIASILGEEQDPEQKHHLMVLYSLVLKIAQESAAHKAAGMDVTRVARNVLKRENEQFAVTCSLIKNQAAIEKVLDILAANFPEFNFKSFKERQRRSVRDKEKHKASPLEQLGDLINEEKDPTLHATLQEFADEALRLGLSFSKQQVRKTYEVKTKMREGVVALRANYIRSVRKSEDLKRILELLAMAYKHLDFKTIIELFD